MRAVVFLIASLFTLASHAKAEFQAPFISPAIEQSSSVESKSVVGQPGLCEFEIQNLSHKSAFIDVVYDSFLLSAGNRLDPGYNLHVHLRDRGGICHRAAYVLVYSPEAIILFKDFGFVDKTLRIYSGFNSDIKVKQVDKK